MDFRCAVISGIVLSIFALIVGIVALMANGFAAEIFGGLTGCYNTRTDQSWGTSAGQEDAYRCAANDTEGFYFSSSNPRRTSEMELMRYSYYYNMPNSTNNNFFYNHPHWIAYYNANHNNNWYATHNAYYWNEHVHGYYYGVGHNQCVCTDQSFCYGYDLRAGDNDCGIILTTYTNMLGSCVILLLFLLLLTFIYSVFGCFSASSNSTQTLPVTTVEPLEVQMAGTAVFVQPGAEGQPVVYSGVSAVPTQYSAQYAPLLTTEGDAQTERDVKY